MVGDTSQALGPGDQGQRIINELLASACHAITTSKTDEQIATSFALFYDDDSVKEAYDKLKIFYSLPRRCQKKDRVEARIKDVSEIVNALREIDWTAKNVQFLVSDISKICYVHGGLGDEIQMRDELQQVKRRLSAMEEQVSINADMNSKVNQILETVNRLKDAPNTSTYSDVLKNVKSTPPLDFVRNKRQVEPVIKRPNAFQSMNPFMRDPNESRKATHFQNHSTPTEQWTEVKRKKHVKKKVHVTGNCDDDTGEWMIKSSCTRPLKLFVSRCEEKTTTDELKSFLTGKHKWNVMNVDKLNTRFGTYSSFKVTLNRKDASISDFLKPEMWPSGIMVRLFLTKRWGAASSNNVLPHSPINI